ncbi:MAG: cytochrome c oxidase accessory protein FixG [Myxococcota bacterium]|jgi:cytochrome c oxidase accessory protein FixG
MAIPARTATVAADGTRVWVYPRDIPGGFHKLHRWTSAALHVVLFVVPWLSIGGKRVLHIDVAGRRVWALGQMFTAADGVLLMLMGLLAAFLLFFFTSLFGRLWCGFACPQSVFLINWVLPVEQWIEGIWKQRIKRDGKGFTVSTTGLKATKFTAFAAIAFLLSMGFMGFFSDPAELWTLRAGSTSYGVVAFFTGLWFLDFAYAREQVCNYICPYARFQGALMDEQSLTITYDVGRGEARGGKGAARDGRCLDCNWCVQVCPQGIDIRDGFQLECIACGRCVDACTAVMAKASPSTETLISYGTIAEQQGRDRRTVRFRTALYAALLTGLAAAFLGVLLTRAPFEVTVNRAPGSLFQIDGDLVRNTFLVHLTNTADAERAYSFDVEGLDDAVVTMPAVTLGPYETRMIPLAVQLARDRVTERTYPLHVHVDDGHGAVTWETTFKTPGPGVAP